MTILKDVGRELWSMFVADLPLTLALLALVGAAGGAIALSILSSGAAGVVLALGTVVILLLAILRLARPGPRR